jgi:type VI secretion system protein ImpC
LVALVDEARAAQMSCLLHHPDFQALESLWRGVHFLIRQLDTDEGLELWLLDLSKPELTKDLLAEENLANTSLYKWEVQQTLETPGGQPWAVVAGAYTFSAAHEDVEVLGRLARIARCASGPFIAEASPQVVGCASLAQSPEPEAWKPLDADAAARWQTLRQLPEASHLGLALPRFLLRLPYGKETNPVDRFDYTEMTIPPRHEEYLWGNAAFACLYLLGAAFNRAGWGFQPGMMDTIQNLPLHMYRDNDEAHAKPCAEVLLTTRAERRILDFGIMPLLSVRDSDSVQLSRFQSLVDPSQALAGRWQ